MSDSSVLEAATEALFSRRLHSSQNPVSKPAPLREKDKAKQC